MQKNIEKKKKKQKSKQISEMIERTFVIGNEPQQ